LAFFDCKCYAVINIIVKNVNIEKERREKIEYQEVFVEVSARTKGALHKKPF